MKKVRQLVSHVKSKTFKSSTKDFPSCHKLYNAVDNTIRDKVQFASTEQIKLAVEDASTAQEQWSCEFTPTQRSEILQKASSILKSRFDELSRLEVKDTARVISEVKSYDIPTAVRHLSFYANMPAILSNGTYHDIDHSLAYVKREPIGLTVGIGAWNFPLMNAISKSAPALSFGNAMLYKPSEMTPNSALILAEIYEEAGVPPGLFQVLLGDGLVGSELIKCPMVGKISFTGSAATGRKLCENQAASNNFFPKMTLELGGKSPLICFDDADLDAIVTGVMQANWYANGQVCSNGTRVFVHKSMEEEFLDKLIDRTNQLKIGDPMQDDTDIGPMMSESHMNKVLDYIAIGKNKDLANLVYGGERIGGINGCGFFLSPAIFTDCKDEMKIVQEEVFGMLMSVLTFEDEEEVVSRANATQYGLGAGIFTNDLKRAHRVANALKARNIWINNYNLGPVELPWGGLKNSGVGCENGSYDAQFEWTSSKSVYIEMAGI